MSYRRSSSSGGRSRDDSSSSEHSRDDPWSSRRSSSRHNDYGAMVPYRSRTNSARSMACTALTTVGVSPDMAVVAVELVHRGVRILKKKTSHLAHKTGVRLKRLMFNREEPPPNTRITIIITGVSEDNMYAAQVEMEAYREGTTLSTSDLPDVKLLVLGCFGVSVKDLGNFTRGEPSPYALLLPLQDVFAVIRHYWIHEKVSEYKKGELDYTIIKIRSKANRHTVVRVVWENSEDKSNSRATVITEKNWKKSAFGGKSRVLDKYSDVDIMQMHDDRMLAFGR